MTYRNAPWSSRLGTLGDAAEEIYEKVKPLGPTTRWGFRRPEGVAVSKFPIVVAHTPDYVTYQHYVEVAGMGKDGVLKSIKEDKWKALQVWQKISKLSGLTGGVILFVWNSAKKEFAVVPFTPLSKLVKQSLTQFGILSFENDNNKYHPIPWEWIKESAVWTDSYKDGP